MAAFLGDFLAKAMEWTMQSFLEYVLNKSDLIKFLKDLNGGFYIVAFKR